MSKPKESAPPVSPDTAPPRRHLLRPLSRFPHDLQPKPQTPTPACASAADPNTRATRSSRASGPARGRRCRPRATRASRTPKWPAGTPGPAVAATARTAASAALGAGAGRGRSSCSCWGPGRCGGLGARRMHRARRGIPFLRAVRGCVGACVCECCWRLVEFREGNQEGGFSPGGELLLWVLVFWRRIVSAKVCEASRSCILMS